MTALQHNAARFGTLLRRSPVTMGLITLMWSAGIATGSVLGGPSEALLEQVGVGVPSMQDGRWWTLLTAPFFCWGFAPYLLTTVLFLAIGVPAERLLGRRVCGVVLLASQVLGGLAAIGLIAAWSALGDPWMDYLASGLQVGPSAAIIGLGFALSFRTSALWRRRLRLILSIGVVVLTLYSGTLQDVLRLVDGLTGFGVGFLLLRRRTRITLSSPSRSETKVLVAMVVAATAFGPIATLFSRSSIGPLGLLQSMFASPVFTQNDVQAVCADPTMVVDCRLLRSETLGTGIGSAITSVAPALLLLAAAEGLRRGRRFAWWLALVFNSLLAIGCVVFIGGYLVEELSTERAAVSRYLIPLVAPVLVPIFVVLLLLITRRVFTIAAPRRTYLRLSALAVISFAAASGVYLCVGYLDRAHFDPRPGILDLFNDVPTRFLPPGYQLLNSIGFLPTGGLASIVWEFSGAVFWVIMLVGLLVSFWRAKPASVSDAAARARTLMLRDSGSSLAYMTTWPGNHYWFADHGESAFAYRVVATVALTTGGPLGDQSLSKESVTEFGKFCRDNGWTPCLYSITEGLRDIARELGWHTVQVAEDTIIPLSDLEFVGKKWQDIRTALNKAAKAGIVAEWIRYSHAPLSITDQIRVISEEWVADKGMPEMGFTLGGTDELDDPQVRCLIAVDADRTVHGVTSWLPVYRDNRIVGWTLDFMRRRASGFRGVMEFLIASAAQSLQSEGAEFISLSGAPLARLDRGEQTGGIQRILDVTGRALEPVYGFHSLLAFKAKFQPHYQPLYMAYPDSSSLPAIGNAIGRAYLPDLTTWQSVRLVGKILTWSQRSSTSSADGGSSAQSQRSQQPV